MIPESLWGAWNTATAPNDCGGAKKSLQCHTYFLQCKTFALWPRVWDPVLKVIYHFACQAWGGVPKKALLLALKSKYLGLPKFWADYATATGFTEVKLSRYLTWQMVNYVFNAMCIAMTCRLLLCCIIFCSLRSAMFLATIHWRVIMVLFRDRRLNYVMWSTRRNILGQHVDLEAGSCVAAKIYV